jgi:phage anti-repressor protein
LTLALHRDKQQERRGRRILKALSTSSLWKGQTLNTLSHALPVVVNTNGEQTIDARSLHKFLENGDTFSHWIKDRIEQYDFKENGDYFDRGISPYQTSVRGGDRRSREYALAVGMAKELCMVERNAKGKQARLYFLECERRAKNATALLYLALRIPNELREAIIILLEHNPYLTTTAINEVFLTCINQRAMYELREMRRRRVEAGELQAYKQAPPKILQ